MTQRVEKNVGPITIVPNRDWKILFLVAAVFLIFSVAFLAPEETTQETFDIMQGLVFTLIGVYGGIRGRGEQKSAAAGAVDNENNTFGVKAGVFRGLAAIVVLFLIGYAFLVSEHDKLVFLVLTFSEILGISIPPIAKGET